MHLIKVSIYFQLVLTAKDNGTIPISTPINVQIVVFITVPVDPIFTTDCTLEFPGKSFSLITVLIIQKIDLK